MYLQEKKKPNWKIREEIKKKQSFDTSLAELGKNGAFLNAKIITKKLEKATLVKNEVSDSCIEE